jgi:acetyl-CoA acetyltransferase
MVVIMLPWSRREDSGSHAAGCTVTFVATRAASQPAMAACWHCHQQCPSCFDPVHAAAKSVNLGIADCMTALYHNVRQIPEHTWGADVKAAMPDYRNWSNADFHAALATGHYSDAVHCWRRQRAYLDWGLEALSED